MNSLYFWKNWNNPYKQIYFFLLTLLGFVLIALAYSSYVNIEGVVKWEVETELEPVKVVIDQFSKNLFNFTVESESYYALDKFVSTEVQINPIYAYLFLTVIILSVLFLITTISYLDLYWYMGGMMLFLFFLYSMKMEMIGLFGRIDGLPMVGIFLLYGGVSFVFNSYYKSASYLFRWLVFFGITFLLAILIYKFSTVANPFLYLANFGSLFPVWVTLLFVFVIGHDIIKGFLYLVAGTKTAGSKNSMLNFFFASILYLANVLLLLLKKLYILQLDIIYLNPFLLLVVSSILGIWMFKKRTEMFSGVLPFAPAGAYVYLSLAIISLSGAAYAFINGNIGMIEAYERIIVYGHLFVGFVFLLYVMVNFLTFFDKKISIFEIVYQPARLTFLIVPAVSITMSIFFFLYQRKYPYKLALSGYYTYAGDVMAYEGQYPLAFQYYERAVGNDFPNYRANYSIASLASSLGDKQTAKGYYENALSRDLTVQSYIGLSNTYVETGELFKALFQIQEGLKKFPGDGRLTNNLGVLYHKVNLADSSIHYFLKAKKILGNKEVPTSNILYLLAKKELFEDADSIAKTENYPEHLSFLNNKLAILNQLGKKSKEPFDASFFKDTTLNANTYSYLVNSNINSIKDSTNTILMKIDELRQKSSNQIYKDNLSCQSALKKYYSGNRFTAIQEMILLNASTTTGVEYSTILGYWMMEQEQYLYASEYFKNASKGGNGNTQINYVISAVAADQIEDALFVLEQLRLSPDKNITGIAEKISKILAIKDPNTILLLEEPERLQYFLLRLNKNSLEISEKVFRSFKNEQAKVYAGAALCKYCIERNNTIKAGEIFSQINDIKELNIYTGGERNFVLLWLATLNRDGKFLSENAKTLQLNSDKELLRNFFVAASFDCAGDTANASRYYFKNIISAPYMEKALAKSVKYLSAHGQQQTVYNYLVEIVQNTPTIEIEKTYLELCLDMSLISYAESMLSNLKGRISAIEYAEYQTKLAAVQIE
jgi:hypothetical protein